jgi:hypothetical protein
LTGKAPYKSREPQSLDRQPAGFAFFDTARLAIDPIAHLVAHNPADTDAPRFRQCLQPRRNIDAVAEDVVLFYDHVAEIDADAEPDPALFGYSGSRLIIPR